MAQRKGFVGARILSDEDRTRLVASPQGILRDKIAVYRGRERQPMISVASPARGTLTRHAVRLLGDCSVQRGLGTRYPQAVRLFLGGLPGFVLLEPVAVYDPLAGDQYQIRWNKENRRASLGLLAVLQPIGHDVPKYHVSEMPVSLENAQGNAPYLVIHAAEGVLRARRGAAVQQPGSAEEQPTTAAEKA